MLNRRQSARSGRALGSLSARVLKSEMSEAFEVSVLTEDEVECSGVTTPAALVLIPSFFAADAMPLPHFMISEDLIERDDETEEEIEGVGEHQ